MFVMLRRVVFALASFIAAAPLALAAPPDAPDNYAEHWRLQLPAGASLVRLPLYAEVLTQVQTADLSDLRVFNAAGQPVPRALDRSSPETRAPVPDPITLPALPILADPQTASAGGTNLSLRIEEGPGGGVVQLNAPPAGAASSAATHASSPALVGALVDTRTQKAALQAIELDATWPAARPFTFHLYTSNNLQQWQPLDDVTVYRGADGVVTAPAHLPLDGTTLQAHYLRITWDTSVPNAVQVRNVRLLPMPPQATPERVAVPLALAQGATHDAHVLEWGLPFATPVAALDIRAAGPATLIPVRVLARQQREQPWTPLASHVVFSLNQDGRMMYSPPLELGQAAWREWRVEADAASPGFTTPPQITAWFAPVQLVFVASGAPPFTLAAGRANAPGAYLPLESLIPGYQPGAQNKLPAAKLAPTATGAAPDTTAAVPTTAIGAQRNLRGWTLWAILLVGVLVLGGMAWTLVRQLDKPAPRATDRE
jgi:hypothetical protein